MIASSMYPKLTVAPHVHISRICRGRDGDVMWLSVCALLGVRLGLAPFRACQSGR